MFRSAGRVVVLVVAVAAVGSVVAYLLLPPRQTADISVPADDATAEQVVATYLDALNAHDCGTAEAVMTEEARAAAESWCHDVSRLSAIRVGDHTTERPSQSGRSPSEQVVNVPVSFDLSWRPFHDDGSMAPGATTWGYLLVRDSPGSPWRIFDQGVG